MDIYALMLASLVQRDSISSTDIGSITKKIMAELSKVANMTLPLPLIKGVESRSRFSFNVMEDAAEVIHRRLLFATRTGLIGLGPAAAQPGDICCIFFGRSAPYILRPVGSRYRLIGHSYVPGIMEGQAVMEHELVGTFEERNFDIY